MRTASLRASGASNRSCLVEATRDVPQRGLVEVGAAQDVSNVQSPPWWESSAPRMSKGVASAGTSPTSAMKANSRGGGIRTRQGTSEQGAR
jgi:hypothetical protein